MQFVLFPFWSMHSGISYIIVCFLFSTLIIFRFPQPARISYTYRAEFLKWYLSIEICIRLDNCTIDQLLELYIIQVIANHHLQHQEQFTIWNESISVDIVDCKSETELFLLGRTCGERIQTLHEFQERNVSILILIKYCDNSLDQRIVCKLCWKGKEWVNRKICRIADLPGMSKNSSGSSVPLLSLSILLKFLYNFWSSFSETKGRREMVSWIGR